MRPKMSETSSDMRLGGHHHEGDRSVGIDGYRVNHPQNLPLRPGDKGPSDAQQGWASTHVTITVAREEAWRLTAADRLRILG